MALTPGAPACARQWSEHRVQEALGLSGAGSCRDDRRLPSRQPVEGVALVAPGREAERRFRERLAAFQGVPERQVDREIRSLEEVVGVGEELLHHAGQGRIRRAEAGGEEVLQCVGDFGRERGGDHECRRRSWGWGWG